LFKVPAKDEGGTIIPEFTYPEPKEEVSLEEEEDPKLKKKKRG